MFGSLEIWSLNHVFKRSIHFFTWTLSTVYNAGLALEKQLSLAHC